MNIKPWETDFLTSLFFTLTLFSLASFHREVRGKGQMQSSESRPGRSSVSCLNLHQWDGRLPTQRAWTQVRQLRDGHFNQLGLLPSLMFVMPRLWPQIKAGVALQPQSWCQNKPICPVMTDRTWPNPCESRGNMTDLCGVRLPQLAWETASITVQCCHHRPTKLALALAPTRHLIKKIRFTMRRVLLQTFFFLRSDADAAWCYLFIVPWSQHPEDHSIYIR